MDPDKPWSTGPPPEESPRHNDDDVSSQLMKRATDSVAVPSLSSSSSSSSSYSSITTTVSSLVSRYNSCCFIRYSKYLPLFYVFLSGVGFSLQSLIIKLLGEKFGFHSVFQVVFMRGIIQMLMSSFYIRKEEAYRDAAPAPPPIPLPVPASPPSMTPPSAQQPQSDAPSSRFLLLLLLLVRKCVPLPSSPFHSSRLFGSDRTTKSLLLFRSLTGFGGIAFAFLAITRLPIGDATVLVMLSPTLTSVLAVWILKEPWTKWEMAATPVSIMGGLLVARPVFLFGLQSSDDGEELNVTPDRTGVLYGVLASVFASFAYISVRLLGTTSKISWYYVTFSQGLGQVLLALPCQVLFRQKFEPFVPQRGGIGYGPLLAVVTSGTIGAYSQFLMTLGMQREKSASATMMRLSDVVFGFVWTYFFTMDAVAPMSALGAFLVTGAVGIVVAGKQRTGGGDTAAAAAAAAEVSEESSEEEPAAEQRHTREGRGKTEWNGLCARRWKDNYCGRKAWAFVEWEKEGKPQGGDEGHERMIREGAKRSDAETHDLRIRELDVFQYTSTNLV